MGENCPYYTDGYTEARLFTNTRNEIEGPGGMYTKQIGIRGKNTLYGIDNTKISETVLK